MTPAELRDLATEVAREAGALLRDRPTALQTSTKSTPTDAVTDMDRAAERLIVDRLRARRPDDLVVGEESGQHGRDGAGIVSWLVDPLDGTVNYLYGIPQYAVSIAARIDGDAIAGAVFDVMRDELYAASRDGGATCNGALLRCSDQTDLGLSLVATGFAYAAETRRTQAAVLTTVLPAVRDIRRLGSAALDLCMVASGRVDAYFEAGMQPWDWAAGALIATEAGARVGGLGGRPPGSWTTLAANPALFAELEALLVEAGDPSAAS
ncbi:MAG TPA: inositol monophosphatase family protein [Mycobacteriales bacterium]|nr:inositol monophosphatase family protein [Mycobacteriales bacterium]